MHNHINISKTNCNILYVSISKVEEGFNPSPHIHKNIEIILILDGEGDIISNKKFHLKRGDLAIINPNERHYQIGPGLSYYAIGINGKGKFLVNNQNEKIMVMSLAEQSFLHMIPIFEIIIQEAQKKTKYSYKIINHCSSIIYLFLSNNFEIKEFTRKNNENEIVESIKEYISHYYSSNISLDELASKLSTSKTNICHQFKKETGISIIEFKLQTQIEEACNLLKISDMNVSQISNFVGFNSDSYFIKKFKHYKKITPKEFQQLHNKDERQK